MTQRRSTHAGWLILLALLGAFLLQPLDAVNAAGPYRLRSVGTGKCIARSGGSVGLRDWVQCTGPSVTWTLLQTAPSVYQTVSTENPSQCLANLNGAPALLPCGGPSREWGVTLFPPNTFWASSRVAPFPCLQADNNVLSLRACITTGNRNNQLFQFMT